MGVVTDTGNPFRAATQLAAELADHLADRGVNSAKAVIRADETSAAVTVTCLAPLRREHAVGALRAVHASEVQDFGHALQGVAMRWHAPVTVTVQYAAG